jgi:hypothetical protein
MRAKYALKKVRPMRLLKMNFVPTNKKSEDSIRKPNKMLKKLGLKKKN